METTMTKTTMIYVAEPLCPIQHDFFEYDEYYPYYTISLDMDGVLANFDQLYLERSGHSHKEFLTDDNGFWKAFREGEGEGKNFFADISPFPYYLNFLKDIQVIAEKSDYEIRLLSALSIHNPETLEQQAIDKTKWVQKYLWDYGIKIPAVYVESSGDKKLYSGKREILIDDLDSNISQWRQSGVIGIVHKNFNQSVQELKMVLELHEGEK